MKTLKTVLAILIPTAVIVGVNYLRIHFAAHITPNFLLGLYDGVMFPYLGVADFFITPIPNYSIRPLWSFYGAGYFIGVVLMAQTLIQAITPKQKPLQTPEHLIYCNTCKRKTILQVTDTGDLTCSKCNNNY